MLAVHRGGGGVAVAVLVGVRFALALGLPRADLGLAAQLDVLEEAHEHVGAQAALVRLVQDDDVVRVEVAVAEHLGEEGAVGRILEARTARGAVVEPDRVADEAAELLAHLGRDALGERGGGDPAGLGADDSGCLARDRGAYEELRDLCERHEGQS